MSTWASLRRYALRLSSACRSKTPTGRWSPLSPTPPACGLALRGDRLSRRKFLANTSALWAAPLLGPPRAAAAEPPAETKKIRFLHTPSICVAPQYLAEELLRVEGFSEIVANQEVTAHEILRQCWRTSPAVRSSGSSATAFPLPFYAASFTPTLDSSATLGFSTLEEALPLVNNWGRHSIWGRRAVFSVRSSFSRRSVTD